jgi:Putative DNA-binding domain
MPLRARMRIPLILQVSPMSALPKPLHDLTLSDLQVLIDEEWSEDETLEFKESLSHPSGRSDKWFTDQSSIGDSAKRDLLAEVVAMANSYGGDVILGVVETDEKPPRAQALSPLPSCIELASRLEYAARDLIKPQIPMMYR